MATKTLVRVSDGAIVSKVALAAPNDENQPPKKNDDGSKDNDDKKIAAKEKETSVKHPLGDNMSNSEVEVDNMSTTHVTKTKDEKKSTASGTRRSNRQNRPIEVDDVDEEEGAGSDKKNRRRKQGEKKFIIDLTDVPMQAPILKHDGKTDGLSSKYLGVHWENNKWVAQIRIDGKKRKVGRYDSEEDAAADYARAVFKLQAQRRER